MKKVYVWYNQGYEEETGYRYAIEPKTVKKGYTFIGMLSENYQLFKAENAPIKMVEYFVNMLGICYTEVVMEKGVKESVFSPEEVFAETVKRLNEENEW